jgi:hypothetical protein
MEFQIIPLWPFKVQAELLVKDSVVVISMVKAAEGLAEEGEVLEVLVETEALLAVALAE